MFCTPSPVATPASSALVSASDEPTAAAAVCVSFAAANASYAISSSVFKWELEPVHPLPSYLCVLHSDLTCVYYC